VKQRGSSWSDQTLGFRFLAMAFSGDLYSCDSLDHALGIAEAVLASLSTQAKITFVPTCFQILVFKFRTAVNPFSATSRY
jgi:hypothetical protein